MTHGPSSLRPCLFPNDPWLCYYLPAYRDVRPNTLPFPPSSKGIPVLHVRKRPRRHATQTLDGLYTRKNSRTCTYSFYSSGTIYKSEISPALLPSLSLLPRPSCNTARLTHQRTKQGSAYAKLSPKLPILDSPCLRETKTQEQKPTGTKHYTKVDSAKSHSLRVHLATKRAIRHPNLAWRRPLTGPNRLRKDHSR